MIYSNHQQMLFQNIRLEHKVYYKSEVPRNAFGEIQPTKNFREGDYRYNIKDIKTIKAILPYPRNIRYILNGKPKVSYAESELIKQ